MNLLKIPKTIKYLASLPQPYFPFYGVLFLIGYQGGGKTITAVDIAYKRLISHPKTTFISNVVINDIENPTYYYSSADELMKIILEVIDENNKDGYLIFIDEVHVVLNDDDSKVLTKSNFITFLSQQRKLSINMICTSQLYNKVPKYFRDYVIQQGQIIICSNFWLLQFNYWLDMKTCKEDDKGYVVYEKASRKLWLHSYVEYQRYDTFATISQIKSLLKKGDDSNVGNVN